MFPVHPDIVVTSCASAAFNCDVWRHLHLDTRLAVAGLRAALDFKVNVVADVFSNSNGCAGAIFDAAIYVEIIHTQQISDRTRRIKASAAFTR